MSVRLRRIEERDLDLIFMYRNQPTIHKWCRQNGPLHKHNHIDWYHWQRKDTCTSMFAITSTADDDFVIGVCGLTSIDHLNGKAEFSCYIDRENQGNGYATLALIKLFDFGFGSLNLNIIWGETFEGNPAYYLFTEKLGMKHEGTRRQFYFKNGRYLDANLISITREEWKSKDSL